MKPLDPNRAVWTEAEYEWVIGEWQRRQVRALGPLVLVLAVAAIVVWAIPDAPRTDPLPSTNPLPPLVIAGVAGLLGWNASRQWRCPACDRPPARYGDHRRASPRECVHCRAPLRR